MEGSYVSENGVRFDSKHSSTLDTSSKCRRMQDRVGRAMAEKIKKFKRKMETIKNGKKRKMVRAETWVKLSIKLERLKRHQKTS